MLLLSYTELLLLLLLRFLFPRALYSLSSSTRRLVFSSRRIAALALPNLANSETLPLCFNISLFDCLFHVPASPGFNAHSYVQCSTENTSGTSDWRSPSLAAAAPLCFSKNVFRLRDRNIGTFSSLSRKKF